MVPLWTRLCQRLCQPSDYFLGRSVTQSPPFSRSLTFRRQPWNVQRNQRILSPVTGNSYSQNRPAVTFNLKHTFLAIARVLSDRLPCFSLWEKFTSFWGKRHKQALFSLLSPPRWPSRKVSSSRAGNAGIKSYQWLNSVLTGAGKHRFHSMASLVAVFGTCKYHV